MPRILVVDDNAIYRELVVEILETSGYNVVASLENGQEAINFFLNGGEVDLIISDFQMPEVNGIELIRQIKNEESLSKIPVILATGKAHDNDICREARAAGASAIIGKPFYPIDILLAAVENAIGPPEKKEEVDEKNSSCL